MLYDTHAHVNFSDFKENYKQILTDTLTEGVWVNNVGSEKDSSAEAVRIAQEFPEGVYAVVGIHPDEVAQGFNYEFYKKLALDPKTVGIGECGLDYFRLPENMQLKDLRELQEPVFEEQIRLAKEVDKALVIHCRASKGAFDAYEDVLALLEKHEVKRFEIHSFTANWEVCQRFLDLGGYIGLNAIITFDKSGVLKEVVQNCPLDKILLETDAPWLAPAPFRGKQNQPAYVKYVAEFIAQLKGESVERVAEITSTNARLFFKIQS